MKIPKIVKNDSYLKPYTDIILNRMAYVEARVKELSADKAFTEIGNGYLYYGLHQYPDQWILREWAPKAETIYVIGDFSNWEPREEYRMQSLANGNWEICLPANVLQHFSLYKLLVVWPGGRGERIPSYCRRVVQDDLTKVFSAQVWKPLQPYQFKHKRPVNHESPFVYEAHIGMSAEEEKVSNFVDFRINVLPRIVTAGYNTIQLMALQEHPYYGSFGYQVSSFFAVSSRFGTPDELKELIDTAHGLGIRVVMDIVHSHAVSNESEGLSKQDGSSDLYFHAGERGDHPAWGSRCFDYGKNEVLSFLLSNCKYWLEEFQLDGFRFDGVTSMLYLDHGLEKDFVSYNDYFDGNQDLDAIAYLALANRLIHELHPHAITIAEDVSGLPGLATSQEDGGVGFDYRMAMAAADYWIKIIKTIPDEAWRVGDIYYELTNKRIDEKTIAYAECHDQAMVGDQTLIFRLIERNMYDSMGVKQTNLKVDRGIALHKLIRLLTMATAGNGYLNFMGNEFGHPEWIDFPREGNDWSYKYARRQWSLQDDKTLRYQFLGAFDKAMITVGRSEAIYTEQPFAITQNNEDQILVFKRAGLIFALNFNPTESFFEYGFKIDEGTYEIVLNTDCKSFNGFNRIDEKTVYRTQLKNGEHWLNLYLPARTALVLKITN